ncbi:trypsin-like serine peptidase [Pseudobacteriovorax antillogorgiicola]|uniref:Serine protease n=1 Tax=Pseudobacteriovorax antillogorgiicola TaxID=1513793 RepID=A0A1Y6BFB4_9BACT|nr:serine protease [Pseudobacteriovorax antillogorgiicola]TCS56230.1 V8-like Glu-specific endopeptidase [Pseudobacteriovorax antillogorgiicola]SMF08261.1 V8-like Glu-specific endopeptidase [Pseudobacteriovorax antillogorgiicola]
MKFTMLVSSTLLFVISCGQDNTSQLNAELGTGQLRPWQDHDLPISGAIGTLDGQCTVFHIGSGLVATAAHCLAPQAKAGDPCLPHQVAWHDGSISQCVQVMALEFENQRDIAVFEVDPAPQDYFEIAETDHFLADTESSDVVIYGFPKGEELHVSENCHRTVESTNSFTHTCSTLPGHSGSPVLRASDHKVVGVHNGNRSQRYNYGSLLPLAFADQSQWLAFKNQRRESKTWGPFGNNMSRLLYHIPSNELDTARFSINFRVEDGYDFVKVQDGNLIQYTLTGQGSKTYELVTPILITFESDYAGKSDSVTLQLSP